MQYQDRLDEAEARFADLTDRMADPEVINDSDLYRKTAKAQSELSATRLAPERSAASFRKDVDMLREQVS